MKDYIIWLTSGETISGTMTDEEADRLKNWLVTNPHEPQEFVDTEGSFIVRPERIEAIAVNMVIEHNTLGFR